MSRVQTGLEVLISDYPEKIRGARIGVVCHPASVDAELHHALDLVQAAGARIVIDIADQPYGGRGYACRDLEGYLWWFGSYDPWADHAGGA